LYGVTSEDDGRGYAAAVLPFQSYGAMGMARTEYEADSASSQFFWLLFESDLTPAGKNLLDGRYSCFGYTIENADQLKALREGDMIESLKLVSGGEKLVTK
jgi:cyclophilin family peptidyl-prolyl cis-trans isomerase